MRAQHDLERQAREYEDADHAALFIEELRPFKARTRPYEPDVLLGGLTGTCHVGRRASRYADSRDDIEANPGTFRCQTCGMLLDAPAWVKAC